MGSWLGNRLADQLGSWEGINDGTPLNPEGLCIGNGLGNREGKSTGFTVRLKVGRLLGTSEGDALCIRKLLGDGLGGVEERNVGPTLGFEESDPGGLCVGKPLGTVLCN